MNKLLVGPLLIMYILTLFSMFYNGQHYDYNPPESYYNGTTNLNGTNSTYSIPHNTMAFGIDTPQMVLLILISGLTAGVFGGLHVLGTGLSDTSQIMMFILITFLGLWACLTIATSNLIFESVITSTVWTFLTVCFVIGVGQMATRSVIN